MSPGSPFDVERRISGIIQSVVYGLLSGALIWLLWIYLDRIRPRGTETPLWLEIGFPLAICLGALHFARRGVVAWRRLPPR